MKATLPITSRGIAARRAREQEGSRKWLGSVRDEGHASDHQQGNCCMQGQGWPQVSSGGMQRQGRPSVVGVCPGRSVLGSIHKA